MKYLPLLFVLTLAGCGFIHLTPVQERLLATEQSPVYMSAEELREILPGFALVEDGTYQLTPRGAMPTEAWCNPYAADILRHKDWNCQDYSRAAVEKTSGYAFGLAWNDAHMVNVFVDTDRQVDLFDFQDCQFKRMEVSGIAIKGI